MSDKLDYKQLLSQYNIDHITADSRYITPQSAFFAIKGNNTDGHEFIGEAIKAGAKLIFIESTAAAELFSGAEIIHVSDTRLALARAAAALYPKRPRYMLAVTGTNGKTTTAHLVRQLIGHQGKNVASIGSEGLKIHSQAGKEIDYSQFYGSSLTTPDPVSLHKDLHNLAEQGIEYVILETSSHGLAQRRVGAIEFDAAAFSNISAEHLDYHPTIEDYFRAKSSLFTNHLKPGAQAVINADIDEYPDLEELCKTHDKPVFSVGRLGSDLKLILQSKATAYINSSGALNLSPNGAEVVYNGEVYRLPHYLLGGFQTHNILISLGLCLSCGFEINNLLAVSKKLTSPAGRMEIIEGDLNRFVIVDNCHKSRAMAEVLDDLRGITPEVGKVWLVFGCGGSRDPYKRPVLGETAWHLADKVIITDDNPRDEDPAQIRKQIINSCPGALEIADRKQAIEYAIENMEPSDILLVAGRGSEKYQLYEGGRKIEFNDKQVIKSIFTKVNDSSKSNS
jgi:UDP-N-acetylmuramoyl-L-alanyl-D-glutamate--2,6-diaminopimelate ligase